MTRPVALADRRPAGGAARVAGVDSTSGGSGGSGGAGSGSGGKGGTGGAPMGGSATGGSAGGNSGGNATDAAGDVKRDTAVADAPAGTDLPRDNAQASDTLPSDTAPPADTPPVGATCGGVNCLRLWQLVESCRPMGACVQQTSGTLVNRCYANQVKVRARVNALSNTISTTFVKTDGTNCYLMDTPLLGGGGVQTLIIKELNSTEVARVTITESTAITCAGGSPQTLNDSTCLPPFSLSECGQGDCQ